MITFRDLSQHQLFYFYRSTRTESPVRIKISPRNYIGGVGMNYKITVVNNTSEVKIIKVK